MHRLFYISPAFCKVDFVICVIWRGSTQDNSLEKAGIQKLSLFDMEELSVWMERSL